MYNRRLSLGGVTLLGLTVHHFFAIFFALDTCKVGLACTRPASFCLCRKRYIYSREHHRCRANGGPKPVTDEPRPETRLALSRALTGVSLTHMPAYRVSPPTRRFSSLHSEQHEDTGSWQCRQSNYRGVHRLVDLACDPSTT